MCFQKGMKKEQDEGILGEKELETRHWWLSLDLEYRDVMET